MRAPVSFFDLTQEAVRIIFQSKPLLVLLFPIGLFLFTAALPSQSISEFLPKDLSSPGGLLSFARDHIQTITLFVGFTILVGGVRAALRGPIFLLIEQTSLERSRKQNSPSLVLQKKQLIRSSLFSFLYEGGYWIGLFFISLILLSPLPIAMAFNPALLSTLTQLATLLLLVLAVIFFYIKEFSLLYTLLAHIRPRLALDLGLRLFQKHLPLSLLFGFFLLTLSFLFTFLLNFAIITSALIPFPVIKQLTEVVSGGIILGFMTLLTDALHLLFFHALAATPKIQLQKMGKILEEKKSANSV